MNVNPSFADVDLRRVEEAGLNGLQTQRQLFYDGWLLRVSPGRAKRARSVNAHFGSTLPLAAKIAYCERVYAEHRLPMLFRITPFLHPANLDDELAAHGYQFFDRTLVQLARLARPPEVSLPDGIELTAPSVPAFVDAVGAMQHTSKAQRDAHLERLAQTPLPSHALLAAVDGRAIGCGQIAVEDGIAGVFNVGTSSELRGRGVAAGIVAALLTWAWEHGARLAYLQVGEDNHRAISVYRRFGFATAYTYHYRGRPGECE